MRNQDTTTPKNFVSLILNDEIRIEKVTDSSSVFLKELGAHNDEIAGEKVWVLEFIDERQEAELLSKLNEAGFLFVGEPAGWPPAEIFDYLRKKRLASGRFTEVTWLGSGRWSTRVR